MSCEGLCAARSLGSLVHVFCFESKPLSRWYLFFLLFLLNWSVICQRLDFYSNVIQGFIFCMRATSANIIQQRPSTKPKKIRLPAHNRLITK